MKLLDLVNFAAMGRNGLADHSILRPLKRPQLEYVDISIERGSEDAFVHNSHIGKFRKIEVIVRRRGVFAVVDAKGSIVEDVAGLNRIVDVKFTPSYGLYQWTSHGVYGVGNLPNVVIPFLAFFDINRESVLILVDHLIITQEILLARVFNHRKREGIRCETEKQTRLRVK